MDTLLPQPYLELIKKKEQEGKIFETVMNDVLKDYRKYVMEESFHMYPVLGKRWLGILLVLFLGGIWLVILDYFFLNPGGTLKNSLLYFWQPACVFLCVSVVYLANRLLMVKHKKLAEKMCNVILWICILFFVALIAYVLWAVCFNAG